MTEKRKLEQQIEEIRKECSAIRESLKEKYETFDCFEFLHEMKNSGYEYKVNKVEFINTYESEEFKSRSICFNIVFEDDEHIMIHININWSLTCPKRAREKA